MSKQRDRDEFVARWMEETADRRRLSRDGDANGDPPIGDPFGYGERLEDAATLIRLARGSERYNELTCSVEMSEAEEQRQERREENRTKRARAICAKYGFTLIESGDPRGYAFRVGFPSGKFNTWGGVEGGWGVPS